MFGKHYKYQQVTKAVIAVYLQVVKNIMFVKHMLRNHCFYKVPSDDSRVLQYISSSRYFSKINTLVAKWLCCKSSLGIMCF